MRSIALIVIVLSFIPNLLSAQDAYVVAEHDNGMPSVIVYVKGDQKVMEEGYFANGNLEYVGHFKKGVEHGDFLYYYDDGTLHIHEEWKNGVEHGTTLEYAPDGQLVLEQEWKDGNMVREIVHQ